MKKILTLIISIILIILFVVILFYGLQIGSFQVLSFEQIKQKNEELDLKLEETSKITTEEYEDKIKDLEKTYELYNIQKQKYEEITGFNNDKEKKDIFETKQYDIGYLWGVLGNYARKYNLKLVIDVKKASGQDLYDLYFTLSGEYVNVSQFIKKIEDDSDLLFRIYNFKMIGNSDGVTTTFTVKNISLDSSAITNSNIQSLNDSSSDIQNEVSADNISTE